MGRLVRAFLLDADVVGLLGGEFGELGADFPEVEFGHFLIEFLGKEIDLVLVFVLLLPEIDLRERPFRSRCRSDRCYKRWPDPSSSPCARSG